MKRAPSGIAPVVAVERASPVPLYRQLYDGFRQAVLDRRLRPGERIPSTRALAGELGISRLPLLEAFERLVAEGYLESRVGAGTFVAAAVPGSTEPERRASSTANRRSRRAVARDTDFLLARSSEPWLRGWGAFRVSQPALDRFPFATWSRLVARHGRNLGAGVEQPAMRYGASSGHRPLREAVAAYLRAARAVRCEAEQVLIVSGSQQALGLAARVLLDPGSEVWFEDPGYGGARDVLRLRGARLVAVPVDAEGFDVEAGIARAPRARAAYVTPSHQYPLGATMTAARRLRLLDWARACGGWILEDDYDSEFRYESPPIASLQGLDRDGRVVYVGTFSKVLFPSLRLGYLVVPDDLVDRFAAVRDATDIFPPTFAQAVLADFLREGHFARHLRRMRSLYRERRDALAEALAGAFGGELAVIGAEAGLHLTTTLPRGVRDREVATRAAAEGLWAMPLSSCSIGRAPRQGLVLGYGGTDLPAIRDGVGRLRDLLERIRSPA